MSTSESTIEFLLDQLLGLTNVHARKMFGEYALYCEEKVVALVCDNQLLVKITPPGKALVGPGYQEGEAYPGAKPSMMISAAFIENGDRLCELIRTTASMHDPDEQGHTSGESSQNPHARVLSPRVPVAHVLALARPGRSGRRQRPRPKNPAGDVADAGGFRGSRSLRTSLT